MMKFLSFILLVSFNVMSDDLLDQLQSKKRSIDSNFDGRADIWRVYGDKGRIKEVRYDLNYDKKVDKWVYFLNEKIIEDIDSDFNGSVDQKLVKFINEKNIESKIIFKQKVGDDFKILWTKKYDSIKKQYIIEKNVSGKKVKAIESAIYH